MLMEIDSKLMHAFRNRYITICVPSLMVKLPYSELLNIETKSLFATTQCSVSQQIRRLSMQDGG